MPKITLPITGGFYQSESLPISAQRCINWIPSIVQTANAAQNEVLFPTPGQKSFVTLVGANRGSHEMAEIAFEVNGNTLFQVNEDKTTVSIGTIEGTGRVSMADNGTKLVIVVPGGRAYVYDGTTLDQITDADYILSDTVSYKDGFFVFTASDGSVFFNSELNNPSSIRGLDFGTAEIDPDRIVASHVTHNDLFVIGTKTIEPFQNIGGADFPFQRIEGANIQKGAHAKFSIIGLDETFAFVGGGENEKSAIYQVVSRSAVQKISTPAIDNAIQDYTADEISNCFAMSYFERGNQLAIFTFESSRIPSRTFAYNATTSKILGIPIWFEFQSGVSNNRWNISSIVLVYGKLLAGTTTGQIVELDNKTFDDLGSPILRQVTTLTVSDDEEPFFIPKIILWLESGVGTTTGQGSDPSVSMDFADDGENFGNDRLRKIGKIGKRGQQTEWRRNGRIPVFRVFRFTITAPIKAVVRKLQAVANASGPSG